MHRRDVIRALSAGLALPTIDALAPDTMWAVARTIHRRVRSARQDEPLLVLTEHQDAMVRVLAELIIPETDTPGAAAAHVNRFVDVMLAEWFAEQGATRVLAQVPRGNAGASTFWAVQGFRPQARVWAQVLDGGEWGN